MRPWWNRGCAGIQPCWMLVLFLLVLLLLALLPILAKAAGTQMGCEIQFVDGSRQFIESCVTIEEMADVQSLPYVSTPCQVKMEAAMRAMDGLTWLLLNQSTNVLYPVPDKSVWLVVADKDFLDQWKDAKKECWSKP